MDHVSGPSLKQIVEAILFASNAPVTLKGLREVVEPDDLPRLGEVIAELRREYDAPDRGITMIEIAGGYQILSREECAEQVELYLKSRKKTRLSRAALETLAIVAYRQPVTKVEIDKIRGVDSGGVVGTLLERRLVVIKGRAKAVGSPLLYGTTLEFLNTFGLARLEDLPRLEEMEGLLGDRGREALLAARQAAGIDEELELVEVGPEGEDGDADEVIRAIEEIPADESGEVPAGEYGEGAADAAASLALEEMKETAGGADVIAEAGAASDTEPAADAETPGRTPFGEELEPEDKTE